MGGGGERGREEKGRQGEEGEAAQGDGRGMGCRWRQLCLEAAPALLLPAGRAATLAHRSTKMGIPAQMAHSHLTSISANFSCRCIGQSDA